MVFENIVVEDAQMGDGDGTPYLIELTTTQSRWSTSIIRGSIDDVVTRGITVLSGKKPGFRIWSTDETATIDHVRINELGILGEKITGIRQLEYIQSPFNSENISIRRQQDVSRNGFRAG